MFDLSTADPNLDLPVVSFRRVNVGADIPVPELVGSAYAFAKQRLAELGLDCEGAGNAIDANSTSPKDIVLVQQPTAGTTVAPKTRIRLVYNYVPSNCFRWARPLFQLDAAHRRLLINPAMRRGG